jgi:hypothetical protein
MGFFTFGTTGLTTGGVGGLNWLIRQNISYLKNIPQLVPKPNTSELI